MDEARRERLKESLLILEPLSASQRRAWIAERLGDDAELAAEVERLLATAPLDESLTPLMAPPEMLSLSGVMPERIGPFVVEGLIAQGGMGSVYRAHQTVPVRRRAAVKVLRAELGGRQLFERFEDERQAIARMEHRNVARLLDAGTAGDGRSYIAMELVDGPPITEYACLHGLTLGARLRLFVQVCRGVQHAHNRGILHRDLKPSNILVADEDAQPVPKIIDFGVAKLLAADATRSGQTLSGQLLGTVGYMSPEQADRVQPDADVRSDVYALGTILYELITGTLPVPPERLRGLSVAELRDAIRTHPRAAPSRVVQGGAGGGGAGGGGSARGVREAVPADLDCLVLKASHPDPELRYGSASDLAADLERFLSGRPIAARPPSVWYAARKFVQRHRLPVVSAGLVLAALTAGLLAAGVGFRRALEDRRAAEAALEQVREEKTRADAALVRAEEVSGYLRELLMRAHPARLGPRATFEQLLKASAADFLTQPPANVLVRAEVASALAEPLYLTGDYENVERLLLPQVESLGGEELARAKQLRTQIMNRLGYVASRMSRPADAAARFRQAAEFARQTGDPRLLFQSSGALAQTYSTSGEYDKAIEMLKEMLQSELGRSDELLRASALSNLGVAYGRKGEAAQGLPYSREGYEIRARLSPRDPMTHNMGWQLGIAFMEAGQIDESVGILERNYAASAEASGEDHPDVLAGAVLLGYAKARRGDGAGVLEGMRATVARQRAVKIPLAQVAQSRMYVAGALLLTGARAEAMAEADATVAELEAAGSGCERAVVTVLLQVGSIFSMHGAAAESVGYLERAYRCASADASLAAFAPRIAGALVWSYRRMGDAEGERKWKEIQAGRADGESR